MKKLSALLLGFTMFPSVVFAADDAHGEASKGGLPQFDPTWFASQIFWLAISFAVLYMIFAKKTLPDISGVIENRKNHIQSDLETAEKLTAEADAVQDAYQENLNKAQLDASEAIKSVENKSKANAEAAMETFRVKAEDQVKDAEANIETSKNAAMDDMNKIAIDAAAAAVEKIIGFAPDSSKIETAVKNINSKNNSVKAKAA